MIRCRETRLSPEEREHAIAALAAKLAEKHDAVRDWDKGFDLGRVVLPDGHRDANTEDIREALLRSDNRPVIVVGKISSGQKHANRTKYYIRISPYFEHGAPRLDVLVSCSKMLFERVFESRHNRDVFVAVIRVDAVIKPTHDGQVYIGESGAPISEMYADTYFVTGVCLDVIHVD